MAMDQLYTDTLKELEAVKAERDALAACVKAAQKLADDDRVISYCMSPYPEGKPEGEPKGWKTKMGRDLHLALKDAPDTASLAQCDPHPNCELECGAYGTYCKCAAEGHQ